MTRNPVVGITPDIEFRQGNPSRDFYNLDARNFVALREAGLTPLILPHEPQAIEAYLDILDGVIVSGGGFQFPVPHLLPPAAEDDGVPAEKRGRTEFELALIRQALARDKPLLAVCGGIQTLNEALGGELVVSLKDANPAWAAHRHPPYDSVGHTVAVREGTLMHKIAQTDRFEVNSLHRQGIRVVGEGVVIGAAADDGIVEAIEDPSLRFCLGVQWHPEFHISDVDRRIFQAFASVCAGGHVAG